MGDMTMAQIITIFFKSDICTWYQIINANTEKIICNTYGRLASMDEKYKFYDCKKITFDNGQVNFYIYI